MGVGDDALDNVGTLAQFAGAFVEMLAAGRTAIEHLARRDVVNRAAEIPAGVGVEIGERRVFLTGLMVRQRVIHDGVLCHLGQRDVLAHVIQIGAVVLAHDEKLAAVAEHGWPSEIHRHCRRTTAGMSADAETFADEGVRRALY